MLDGWMDDFGHQGWEAEAAPSSDSAVTMAAWRLIKEEPTDSK